jgi:hypothetical protein
LCKETLLLFCPAVMLLADSGYQGIEDYHTDNVIPIKKLRGGELLPLDMTTAVYQMADVY